MRPHLVCIQVFFLGLKEIQVAQLEKYLSVSTNNRKHTETHVTHSVVGALGYKGPVSLWFLSVCLRGSSKTHTHTQNTHQFSFNLERKKE